MTGEVVYFIFAFLSLAAFRFMAPARATLIVYLGGWMLLPVGNYATDAWSSVFPYWIIGLSLPSDMLLAKSWVAPAAAMLGVIAFDRGALARLRLSLLDLLVAGWCCWPLFQALFAPREPSPPAIFATLYLTGSWGLSWLLGRLYFASRDGGIELMRALGFACVACLPFGVVEGMLGPSFHGWIYDPHPFARDGDVRYIGYRPIGMFEHGSQFGIWIALCAVAAIWIARTTAKGGPARFWWGSLALLGAALAIAAQSVGAVLLAALALLLLEVSRAVRLRGIASVAMLLLLVGGTAYLSGAIPIEKLARQTAVGQATLEVFRNVGRGSFNWRVAQDQALAPVAARHAVVGSGYWDWWRSEGRRPWGLPLLLIGQYGVIGLLLAYANFATTALITAWNAPRRNPLHAESVRVAMAIIVAMAVLDSFLNSFLFFPALLMSGALAGDTKAQPDGQRV